MIRISSARTILQPYGRLALTDELLATSGRGGEYQTCQFLNIAGLLYHYLHSRIVIDLSVTSLVF